MDDIYCVRGARCFRWSCVLLLLGTGLSTATVTGCGKRVLTIEQDGYVNTAVHLRRDPGKRTGDPLEVNIVCVYPGDLKGDLDEINDALSPDSDITSDVWYKNRPQPGDGKPKKDEGIKEREGRFWLPKKQVFLMTDESNQKEYYGTRVGPHLRGVRNDGKKEIKVEFPFDSLFADDAVIYIFPKFIGPPPNAEVLPVEPVKFNPPGAYRANLFIKIGVHTAKYTHEDENYGQYIEIDDERCPRYRYLGKSKSDGE